MNYGPFAWETHTSRSYLMSGMIGSKEKGRNTNGIAFRAGDEIC